MAQVYIKDDTKLPKQRSFNYYPTPHNFVEEIVRRYIDRYGFPHRALDVGSGHGVWGEALRRLSPDTVIHGVELRRVAHHHAYDELFFKSVFDVDGKYDLVFGNPPFTYGKNGKRTLAEDIIVYAASNLIGDGGKICFFLKLQFLSSLSRLKALYSGGIGTSSLCFHAMWPHPKRASFIPGSKKVNADDYATFIFSEGLGLPTIEHLLCKNIWKFSWEDDSDTEWNYIESMGIWVKAKENHS